MNKRQLSNSLRPIECEFRYTKNMIEKMNKTREISQSHFIINNIYKKYKINKK